MKNQKTNSTTTSQSGNQSKERTINSPMFSSLLMKLFEDELKDIYWAEKALTKAIPKMIKNATSQELIDALKSHLAETQNQVIRLEKVFKSIDKEATAKKCDKMESLIKEAEEKMEPCQEGARCDAEIIAAGQKVEYFKIESYGVLRQFAETLGLKKAARLIRAALKEEKAADQKLSEVAIGALNLETAY